MLGLVRRSGALLIGQKACEEAILGNRVKLLILANDAGHATKRNFLHLAEKFAIDVIQCQDKKSLGTLIGYKEAAIIAITDVSWSERLKKSLNSGGE